MEVILLIVFCVLQVLDTYMTYKLLASGVAHEANPVMAWFMEKIGTLSGMIVPKALLVVFLGVFALPYPWLLGILCVLYVWVVVHNYLLMK